jgi:hypothetical protein
VVYKVDRLTRSLADFAKLVELFDAHGVSFVSVTQQFNTTTSIGVVPLGYQAKDRKIAVVEDEARTVRHIFRRYLELSSLNLLLADLRTTGIKTKVRPLSTGGPSGASRLAADPSPLSCATASILARSDTKARSSPERHI